MNPVNSGEGVRSIWDASGNLARERFEDDAIALLQQCIAWLESIGRSMLLPVDLLVVLAERDHPMLRRVIARAARGSEEFPDLVSQLRLLARRVERQVEGPPKLHVSHFSLGLLGILEDAFAWARENNRRVIREDDIVRVVRWRVELQESASVRWAIRQLANQGAEHLFDAEGTLRQAAFLDDTWRILHESMQLSAQSGLPFLGTPHLAAALCSSRTHLLWSAAEAAGVDPRRMRNDLLRIVGRRSPTQPDFILSRRTLTPRLVRMIGAAAERADREGRRIAEADLVEAFLEDGGSSLEVVSGLGVESHIRARLGAARQQEPVRSPERPGSRSDQWDAVPASTPTLDAIGRDLTLEARQGRLPDVRGRDEEVQRIINVLLRTEQRNPLLTGEAGVGKTALAAALAARIIDRRVPKRLRDMRVIEINGASLIGGTSYRGELEARIKSLLAEAEGNVILFIDEAHAVFAPQTGTGKPAEIPNHFKAALASGQIAVIAATTEAEYHRWIEQDPALRRRFERIVIPELSPEISRDILHGLAPRFEEAWDVRVSDEAIDAAVDLSVRFLPEQSLPDKAKKTLMDAAIAVSSESAMERDARPAPPNPVGGANENGAPADAPAQPADAETPDETPTETPTVRLADVARQIASKSGIPLDRIVRGSVDWWVGLEERLLNHVVGQPEAVAIVTRKLVSGRLTRLGSSRPQGVFLFAGPPGVGKSLLARAMADEIFGSRKALIRLDMSDFHEPHTLSRIVGAPPGYVGYEDEDAFVTPLRRRPSSVVLFENFNLAHPRVQERLVRLFEDGEIVDSRGMRASASHAIFVLTVEGELGPRAAIGFDVHARADKPDDGLRDLDEELWRRLRGHDVDVVLFRGVGDHDNALATDLFRQRLRTFRNALREEYAMEVEFTPDAWTALDRQVRALRDLRGLEGLFRNWVIDRVSERILAGQVDKVILLGPLSVDDRLRPTPPSQRAPLP